MMQLIKEQFGLEFSSDYLDENKMSVGISAKYEEKNSSEEVHLHAELLGNPQSLDLLCNLSLIDDQLGDVHEDVAPSSAIFDFSSYKSIKLSDLPHLIPKYARNSIFIVEEEKGKCILFGMTIDKENKTGRVLRIKTDQYPDISKTYEQLKGRYMPFSKTIDISNEAIYSFPFVEYHIKFGVCSSDILSGPPISDSGYLKLRFQPYSTSGTSLPLLKADIDRIKIFCLAYKNEETWNPIGIPQGSENEIKKILVHYLTQEKLTPENISSINEKFACSNRDLDTAERVWEALKDVPDRKTIRAGFLFTLGYLQNRTDLVSLDREHFTQFAKLLSCCTKSGIVPEMEVLGLRMLIELGVNKATNDCFAVIRSVSPTMVKKYSSKYLNTTMSLENRLMHLHHIYKMACLASILTSTIKVPECEKELGSILLDINSSEKEWTSYLNTEKLELDFSVTHQCYIPVSSLSNPLINLLPSLRIVSLSSCDPLRIEKRLVFERIKCSGKKCVYHCHEMELVDTIWLYED